MTTDFYDVANILPPLLSDQEVMNGIGSIALTRKDGATARIFLNQGNVYAIDHLSYEQNLWLQLKFADLINHGNIRSLIRSNKTQRDSLYKLLKKYRNKNLDVVMALKEYLLGAADDIFLWKEVRVDWRIGDQFEYEAGTIPDELPLGRLITLLHNRAQYKYESYQKWSFRDDGQFLYGNVSINVNSTPQPKNILEEVVLNAQRFVVKNVIDTTGYSLYTFITSLNRIGEEYEVKIDNPSGKHNATLPPQSSHTNHTHHLQFSSMDEDENVRTSFNNEYTVPEAAQLETQETFNRSKVEEKEETETFSSFDEVILDTQSLEKPMNLPPLPKETITGPLERRPIPKADLLKEEKAQSNLEELFAPENSSAPEKKQQETPLNTEKEKELVEMVELSGAEDLLGLVERLKEGLQNKRNTIEGFDSKIKQKEQALKEAREAVDRLQEEVGQLLVDYESANSDYEKAVSIITKLSN